MSEQNFHKTNKCVLITGKGYPDVGTRELVRLIADQSNSKVFVFFRFFTVITRNVVPIFVLADCDPYGLDIVCVYAFGSKGETKPTNRFILHNTLFSRASDGACGSIVGANDSLAWRASRRFECTHATHHTAAMLGVLTNDVTDYSMFSLAEHSLLPLSSHDAKRGNAILVTLFE